MNPLHQIEVWVGDHFQAAELWQVETYILVPHHEGETVGNVLDMESSILEQFQLVHNVKEQEQLQEGNSIEA